MKPPEEIKKGLEQCAETETCEHCHYRYDCMKALKNAPLTKDALAYIQQLEAELDDEKNKNEILIFDNDKLMEEIAQTERERDAAYRKLRRDHGCPACVKYNRDNPSRVHEDCPECVRLGFRYFVPRGVCPENTKEEQTGA